MLIEQLTEGLKLTNPGGNFTNNGYPTRIPTITRPDGIAVSTGLQSVGDGVVGIGHGGGVCPQWLGVIPIGAGSSSNTFTIRILHWKETKQGLQGVLPLWVPVTYAEWTVTLGTATGAAGSDIPVTQLFATTITMTGGPTLITNAAAPTALTAAPIVPNWFNLGFGSNAIGMLVVPTFGAKFLEVIYSTGGSATSCNGLYTKF